VESPQHSIGAPGRAVRARRVARLHRPVASAATHSVARRIDRRREKPAVAPHVDMPAAARERKMMAGKDFTHPTERGDDEAPADDRWQDELEKILSEEPQPRTERTIVHGPGRGRG
jgi:hypothetical protein